MAKNTKCKKKSTSKNLEAAKRTSYSNKVAKLHRQVEKNPNDHVAAYALMVLIKEGVGAKGF